MAEEKQISDLHSDQLSQAVLLRFAQSGELERHMERTRDAGRQRLRAARESVRLICRKAASGRARRGA